MPTSSTRPDREGPRVPADKNLASVTIASGCPAWAAVLAGVERKYDEARCEQTLGALNEVASVAIEIIMGLPGDSP